MTVAHGPARRRLILVAVGIACVAIVVFALWLLAGYAGSHSSSTSGDRQVSATIKASASCQGTDTNDAIAFTVAGQAHLAKLDGCGHQPGEVVDVLVPASFNGDTVLEPADAAPGDSSGVSHRVAFLLLVVATAIGGACGYQIFRIRNRPARAGASATGRSIKIVGPARFAEPHTATVIVDDVIGDDDPPGIDPPPDEPGSDDAGSGGVRPRSARLTSGRLAARFRSSSADRDEVYPGESRPPSPDDPEATGVDWFEDSSAHMQPVERPHGTG